jgi:hypothetical protein
VGLSPLVRGACSVLAAHAVALTRLTLVLPPADSPRTAPTRHERHARIHTDADQDSAHPSRDSHADESVHARDSNHDRSKSDESVHSIDSSADSDSDDSVHSSDSNHDRSKSDESVHSSDSSAASDSDESVHARDSNHDRSKSDESVHSIDSSADSDSDESVHSSDSNHDRSKSDDSVHSSDSTHEPAKFKGKSAHMPSVCALLVAADDPRCVWRCALGSTGHVIGIAQPWAAPAQLGSLAESDMALAGRYTDDDSLVATTEPAYVLQTSGTTTKRGAAVVVGVPHAAWTINAAEWRAALQLGERDVVVAATHTSFDPSVHERFAALDAGAPLAVVGWEVRWPASCAPHAACRLSICAVARSAV